MLSAREAAAAVPARLDFPFTPHDTPAVRARIEGDLRRVAARVAEADPRLRALVLTGGFSRGEGTVRGGRPLNDYDLVAVRARPGGGRAYGVLSRALTDELGLEVDLLPVWEARLRAVAPKLFWLDARLGGRVVAGDPLALDRIPPFGPSELGLREIARLLANRAAGLLLAVPGEEEHEDPLQVDLQATKAVLAAMDARLLVRGAYAPRLRERLALARDLPDAALFERAVAWKLAGAAAPLGSAWWREARDALLRAVADTAARRARDGLAEHVVHMGRARRPAWMPSRRVCHAAWDLLALTEHPGGPVDLARAAAALPPPRRARSWGALKRRFFALRARTLQ